jgi:hypothetical protein
MFLLLSPFSISVPLRFPLVSCFEPTTLSGDCLRENDCVKRVIFFNGPKSFLNKFTTSVNASCLNHAKIAGTVHKYFHWISLRTTFLLITLSDFLL